MAKEQHAFEAQAPTRHIERMQRHRQDKGELGIALSELWLGIAAQEADGEIHVGFACHDGTYTIDFAVHKLNTDDQDVESPKGQPTCVWNCSVAVADYLVRSIRAYSEKNHYKFLGAGISQEIIRLSPQVAARIWTELDIVPIAIREGESGRMVKSVVSVDELADSMARKALRFFGPSKQPRVQVSFDNKVEVDLDSRAVITSLEQYKNGVSEQTWQTTLRYAESLKQGKKKFAFFSATPQGGGVALMRHAQMRLFALLGVEASWWVPRPKPEVFRITKTNHNILQGVADPKERLTQNQQDLVRAWVYSNAEHYWTRDGGPLASRTKGGVDVVIVDDPQLPELIKIAKQHDPERPVIFRSHIQVRSDLANTPGTPTAEVWQWLWDSVQHADVFISHPVKAFVPQTVSHKKLAYMPATTDCLPTLAYPKREFITQISRFDPSKGIPDVLASYAEFRRSSRYCKDMKPEETPQLVVAGHYSVDDPDGVTVLNQTLELLDSEYSDIKDSVIPMRLGPTDQLLNALMSQARVGVQLSTREGFEIKVSEGLHKGIPMIVSNAGGIPLQVQDGKSGFIVEPGDTKAVAKHLDLLFSDEQRYKQMSEFAASHVSDEVGTVGAAVCWLYLVDKLSKGQKFEPNGRWAWDLAREEAGQPRAEGEDWLPRDLTT
ncbi:hypothetical protein LTR97_000415 [Elasticomyces elasticus]|uniref:Glycosyl transferase family 1 domain-containing protein n=1 Tax=Elasticomyces elasticus TaxID=574655 RepID=A0AAN7WDG2_9PEZI|nr:hypothetical protein LTR97_000415 [Elasticomyces elasticus]